MDYTGILKRAWDVTWRYKILWVFGFLAGGGGGYGGGGGSRYTNGPNGTGTQQFGGAGLAQVQSFLSQYAGVLVVALIIIVSIFFLLAIAITALGRGGLIHLVNEAEEGRQVRAGDGWHAASSKWGRVFGVLFLTSLPGLVIALIIAAMVGAALVAAASSGSGQAFMDAFGGALVGGVCFGIVLTIVAIFFAVVLGIVGELAVRYVVLKDMRAVESIKQGWHDLFGHKGAFLMFLVLVVVGFVFGIVLGATQFIWVLAPFLLIIGIPLLIVVGAVYGAFLHAAWTIFFRRMTGMETAPAMAAGVPAAPAGYPGTFPPAPPMAPPAPPAEPMMAAPPAPYPPAPPAPPQYAPPAPPEPPASEPPAAPTDV